MHLQSLFLGCLPRQSKEISSILLECWYLVQMVQLDWVLDVLDKKRTNDRYNAEKNRIRSAPTAVCARTNKIECVFHVFSYVSLKTC